MIDNMPVAATTVDPDSFLITYADETSRTLMRSLKHLLPLKADTSIGAFVDVFHRYPEH